MSIWPERSASAIAAGGERGAELDAVQARPGVGAVLRVALEDDAVRGVQRDAEGPGPDRPLLRLRPGDGDRGPPVGQERREDRHGMLEADDDLEVRVGADPGHVRGAAVEEVLQPLDRGEGRRHHVARQADRALERGLDGAARRRAFRRRRPRPGAGGGAASRHRPRAPSAPRGCGARLPFASVATSVSKTLARTSCSSVVS